MPAAPRALRPGGSAPFPEGEGRGDGDFGASHNIRSKGALLVAAVVQAIAKRSYRGNWETWLVLRKT